jgi:hypothetical protein
MVTIPEKVGFEEMMRCFSSSSSSDALAATLQLSGIDERLVQGMRAHSAGQSSDALVDSTLFGALRGSHMSASELWQMMQEGMRRFWHGLEYKPVGPPRRALLHPSLYVIAASEDLPPGALDVCEWTAGGSVAGGLELSLAVV